MYVNMFVYLCISQILLLMFLTTHLAQKTWYQFNIIGKSVPKKHNIIKSMQPKKRFLW